MGGLKIGYLVQQFPPEVGAGPARVTEMALRWRDAGAEVVIFTAMPNRPEGRIHAEYRGKLFPRFFKTEQWEGMRVHRSWLYASPKHGFLRTVANNATFMATAALSALVRLERPDVLIASSPPFFPHVAGAAVSRLRRIPLVLEIRDLWPDYLVGMNMLKEGARATRALFALERRLLRAATHTVVVTESFRRRVIEKGVAPERVDVIPNGVDTALYHPADEEPPVEALARAPGEFLVGYLGNFGAGQGLAAVVQAAALLAGRAPDVRFVLAGDGPDRERVLARAAELGTPNLTVGPAIPKERTRAFYNACDVCLVPLAPYPILQETVPSKIFEVMACERPVLAALSGEGACIVRGAGAGVVVPPGDPEALADAVLALRDASSADRAAMGRRGREHVAEHFSRDALAARYLEILERAANPAPPRALRAAVRPA